MSTYAIKADKFFLPAGPQLGGYLMVEDGVFGAWQADEPSCEIKDYTDRGSHRVCRYSHPWLLQPLNYR